MLTVAVAEWILSDRDLVDVFHEYFAAYPRRGYGGGFYHWAAHRRRDPYYSFGNGAAMRVSPVGFAFDALEEVLDWAERSAAVTHNHPEGIRGAQATAAAIYFARRGQNREQIRESLGVRFGYDLRLDIDQLRTWYRFDETCQGTVPAALAAFLASSSYEDAIRNAISLGGDADTLACIIGGIAEAFYGGVPQQISRPAIARLDGKLVDVLDRFRQKFGLVSRFP